MPMLTAHGSDAVGLPFYDAIYYEISYLVVASVGFKSIHPGVCPSIVHNCSILLVILYPVLG